MSSIMGSWSERVHEAIRGNEKTKDRPDLKMRWVRPWFEELEFDTGDFQKQAPLKP